MYMVKYLLFLIAFFALQSCAEIVPLTGGEVDRTAPKPVEQIPEQEALFYTGTDLVIQFDEFIKLQDPLNTITMNPSVGQLTSELKNKTLRVSWETSLQAETTYILQLNGTIRDNTESNDSIYQFVFSTGKQIDSLQLHGKVTQAFTNKTAENTTVALFPTATDLFSNRPLYATRTTKDGVFSFAYLKAGAFQLVAFQDLNKNQFVDKTEPFGFINDLVSAGDTTNFDFQIYSPKIDKKASVQLLYPGLARLSGTDIAALQLTINDLPATRMEQFSPDSLLVQLPNNENGSFQFIIGQDTLIKRFSATEKKSMLTILEAQKKDVIAGDTLAYHVNDLLLNKKESAITMSNELGEPVPFSFVFKTNKLLLIPEKNTGKKLTVVFEKGALSGQLQQSDSIRFQYTYYQPTDLAELTINARVLAGQWVIQLMAGERIVSEQIKDSATSTIHFKNIIPGTYDVRCIKDENKNGQWDTGSFENKSQPEQVVRYAIEQKLRANWTIEQELK